MLQKGGAGRTFISIFDTVNSVSQKYYLTCFLMTILLLIIVMSMFELLLVFRFATTIAFAMLLSCENHSYL
jgi:hypothetical protein